MNPLPIFVLALIYLLIQPGDLRSGSRSFVIDYENNRYLKDGEPIQIVSGSIHYFRSLPDQWDDRLATMRVAGLNAIQTYVEWSSHEPEEGQFRFDGLQDIVRFLKLAQKNDLLVLLRPGPYIDAERDMGGLPYWLLSKNSSIGLRTSDPEYLNYVTRYFSVLLPRLRPLLYSNGGPIVTVQIENEYGSYHACDFEYTTLLRDLARHHLGNDVVLYTTDGDADSLLRCGKVDGAHTTVDFGTGGNIVDSFAVQRRHQERGPLVNSEFYTGWLDHWAEPHQMVNTSAVVRDLDKMLSMNVSVNLYMFHGGTSFGYKAGSNVGNGHFQPTPTSYDYDAPMNEAGDPTDKFVAIRNVIRKYLPVEPVPVPKPKKKMALGKIALKQLYNLTTMRDIFADSRIVSGLPLSFERIRQSKALVIYDTWIPFLPRNPGKLQVPGLRDRGYVYVDDVYQGIISRMDNVYDIMIPVTKGQRLTVLVESQGRNAFGNLNDPKGIISNVTLSGVTLVHWNMTPINEGEQLGETQSLFSHLSTARTSDQFPSAASIPGLAVYMAQFSVQHSPILDTFLRLDHWKKGVVVLNGFILGRYWTPMGPQKTLYVPAGLLLSTNLLGVIELEEAPCSWKSDKCFVEFVDTPDINSPVPIYE
ncbi:beta-galactosidase-like [Haemaphysalis longicornis]